MMGRTHDLATFTALTYVVATQAPQPVSLATGITALLMGLVGGLTPDIDQPTADLWRKFPAGSVIGRIFYPFLGGHRNISHSIVGVLFFAWLSKFLFTRIGTVVLVDMNIVWYSFMIGYITHLITDSFTQEGVPWLFPIPFKFGIPPLRFLRIKTASFMEKSVIFPGLLFTNAYLYYRYYEKFLDIIRNYIK